MTGSGKTGLCLALLEEAALDGVPAIVIDPKGDLGNLLLTFPELRSADFAPWVDAGEAARKGMTTESFAAAAAESWRKGLAEWEQDGARIQRLRDAVDMAIYTPGSESGRPLSVLRSFAAPAQELRSDAGALREQIGATVSGLLGLVGVDVDPIKSREHILLSSIFDQAWREGRDLDLATLIQSVQKPPFDKVGVFDLETFYPAKERLQLAMALNNLVAAPGFAAWMQGEALDVHRLLHTEQGKPRIAIVSIAHLNDAERMFVVTLLLGEVVAWMRRQSGTSSLRALLYMDEIFGYFPPTAMPPSKPPLLTLMKQARAFGLGVVLATQNPVDLDYKGLSNAGTWFIGRLQTERDKARVVEGLLSAGGDGLDKSRLESLLANLGNRVFLMRNVHNDAPVLFRTRWALSYLRGPMTLAEIARAASLSVDRSPLSAQKTPAPASAYAAGRTTDDAKPTTAKPVVPAGVAEYYLPSQGARPRRSRLVSSPSRVFISSTNPRGLTHGKRAPGSRRWMSAATSPSGPPPTSQAISRLSCRARPPRMRSTPRRRPHCCAPPTMRRGPGTLPHIYMSRRAWLFSVVRKSAPPSRPRAMKASSARASLLRCAKSVTPRSTGCAGSMRRESPRSKIRSDVRTNASSASARSSRNKRCRQRSRSERQFSAHCSVEKKSA